jgi:hypothetical protein
VIFLIVKISKMESYIVQSKSERIIINKIPSDLAQMKKENTVESPICVSLQSYTQMPGIYLKKSSLI